MGVHHDYGLKVLRGACEAAFNPNPDPLPFDEEKEAGEFRIDGTVGEDIAVEVESRASKQVRGALVGLYFHPHPKKLVLVIQKYGNRYTAEQCRVILTKLLPASEIQVVQLTGTGDQHAGCLDDDITRVKSAIIALRQGAPKSPPVDAAPNSAVAPNRAKSVAR